MKLKDYFSKIKEQGKIANPDFDKFLETVPDTEFPDPLYRDFENNFLTIDRALIHDKVEPVLRSRYYNTVDARIKEDVLPYLDVLEAADIDKETNTLNKIRKLPDAIKKTIDKAKKSVQSSTEDKDKAISEKDKALQEITEKFEKYKSESEGKFKVSEKEMTDKISALELNYELKNKIANYTFADEFAERKEAVLKVILSEVMSKGNHLILKDGAIEVKELRDGVPVPKMNGNDLVTIEKLLEPIVSPYLKKNTGAGAESGGGNTQKSTKAAYTGKETLAQMRSAAKSTSVNGTV
jgi:hypothetical protein